MAPSHSRQLLVWSFPTIAILLSYLWFKRKRFGVRSDPGVIEPLEQKLAESESLSEERKEPEAEAPCERKFSRSLSGVETAPIDIILPRELRLARASSVVITDEDLDLEIEKIKSMKNSADLFNRSKQESVKDTQPIEEEQPKVSQDIRVPTPPPQEEVTTPEKVTRSSPVTKAKSSTKKKDTPKMAHKEVTCVEEKFNNLKLGKDTPKKKNKGKGKQQQSHAAMNGYKKNEHEDLHRQSSERDSANHSPADVMLASPSLSSISDNHSEGSNDSGKGGSEVATPPSRTPAGDGSVADEANLPALYEFVIPQTLVGRLIGKHGSFVTEIKERTHAHILIRKHPTSNKLKVCSIEGTQLEIDNALHLIREKFPLNRYPEVTLEQVSFIPPVTTVPLVTDQLYLKLVEGINNDTVVSCMVSPGHLFMQQPTHPSFPNLNVLSGIMNMCYNETDTPLLPKPIPENTVCAAHSVGVWYRAMVLSSDAETEKSYIKFLDYGGYAYVENSKLRQIRADFLLLPFQASECYLANIRPLGGDECSWPEEAYNYVAEVTKGAIIYTQITGYTEEGVPLVLCYVVIGPQACICLNEELVKKGFADWVAYQQEEVEGAVGGVA